MGSCPGRRLVLVPSAFLRPRLPGLQGRLPNDCCSPVAVEDESGVFVAAARVGDGGEDKVQGWSVEPGDFVAEVDQRVAGSDGGGDAKESLFTAG